jgi:hypothetical protein
VVAGRGCCVAGRDRDTVSAQPLLLLLLLLCRGLGRRASIVGPTLAERRAPEVQWRSSTLTWTDGTWRRKPGTRCQRLPPQWGRPSRTNRSAAACHCTCGRETGGAGGGRRRERGGQRRSGRVLPMNHSVRHSRLVGAHCCRLQQHTERALGLLGGEKMAEPNRVPELFSLSLLACLGPAMRSTS